jgi:hypothetical protein
MDSYSGIDMELLEHTDRHGVPCLPPRPRPSYPDEVMRDRTLTSNALLLKLPQEILTKIIGDIDTFSDLRRFALASKDSCQVARSRLFCGVYPKCNRARYKLTSLLSREAKRRKDHEPYPSIGTCVRHIKFRVDENINGLWVYPKSQQVWGSDSLSVWNQAIVEGVPEMRQELEKEFQSLLLDPTNLPNLRSFFFRGLCQANPIKTISHLMLSPTLRTISLRDIHHIIERELPPTENRLPTSEIKLQLQNLYIFDCSMTYKSQVKGKNEPTTHDPAPNYLEPIVKQLIETASPYLEIFSGI